MWTIENNLWQCWIELHCKNQCSSSQKYLSLSFHLSRILSKSHCSQIGNLSLNLKTSVFRELWPSSLVMIMNIKRRKTRLVILFKSFYHDMQEWYDNYIIARVSWISGHGVFKYFFFFTKLDFLQLNNLIQGQRLLDSGFLIGSKMLGKNFGSQYFSPPPLLTLRRMTIFVNFII